MEEQRELDLLMKGGERLPKDKALRQNSKLLLKRCSTKKI